MWVESFALMTRGCTAMEGHVTPAGVVRPHCLGQLANNCLVLIPSQSPLSGEGYACKLAKRRQLTSRWASGAACIMQRTRNSFACRLGSRTIRLPEQRCGLVRDVTVSRRLRADVDLESRFKGLRRSVGYAIAMHGGRLSGRPQITAVMVL